MPVRVKDSCLTTVMMADDRNRNMNELRELYLYWKRKDLQKAQIIANRIRNEFAHNIGFIKELGL